jgi:hypothetical protein
MAHQNAKMSPPKSAVPRETPRPISDLAAAFPGMVAASCVDGALVAWSVDVVLVVDWTAEVVVVGAKKYEAEDELDGEEEEDTDELEIRSLLDGATALSGIVATANGYVLVVPLTVTVVTIPTGNRLLELLQQAKLPGPFDVVSQQL